jgi:hypothetical protein
MLNTPTSEGGITAAYHEMMAQIAARDGTNYTPPAPTPAETVAPSPPSEAAIAALRQYGLSDRDALALSAGKPLTVLADQRKQAEDRRALLTNDPAWVEAYLAGGHKEAAELMEINLRLSATPV